MLCLRQDFLRLIPTQSKSIMIFPGKRSRVFEAATTRLHLPPNEEQRVSVYTLVSKGKAIWSERTWPAWNQSFVFIQDVGLGVALNCQFPASRPHARINRWSDQIFSRGDETDPMKLAEKSLMGFGCFIAALKLCGAEFPSIIIY